jgi:hypothetical protein
MPTRPSVLLVGARSGEVLGESVLCVPTVHDAVEYLGDSSITLALVDTAPFGGTLSRREAVRTHTRAGGRCLILGETETAGGLTWDLDLDNEGRVQTVATFMEFPIKGGMLGRALGMVVGRDFSVDVEKCFIQPDVPYVREVDVDSPLIGYKGGLLWWDPLTGSVLVSGAFSQAPVYNDSVARCFDPRHRDAADCTVPAPYRRCFCGFSAYDNEEEAWQYRSNTPVFRVLLSGSVVLAGPAGSDTDFSLLAGRQRVTHVGLRGVCSKGGCGSPCTTFSAQDKGFEMSILIERCAEHRLGGRVMEIEELRGRLTPVQVLESWAPGQGWPEK